MRVPICVEAAEDPMAGTLHASSRRRGSLKTCVVPPHTVCAGWWKCSQSTHRSADGAGTNPAEKSKQSAPGNRLSLAKRGPSMWPYLSSPLYCLPHLVQYCPCRRSDESVCPAMCWWLREPWSSLAPNDLLSVVTARGHAPKPAGALGAGEARGAAPLLLLGLLCEPVPRHACPTPAPTPWLSSGPSRSVVYP
jgi:hypothetical protein